MQNDGKQDLSNKKSLDLINQKRRRYEKRSKSS